MASLLNHILWYRLSLVAALLLMSVSANAQTDLDLFKGNKLYEQQKYKEAEAVYSKALAKDPNNTTGLFNLGNSLYQQKRYDSSRKVMAATANSAKDKNGKAAANYNIGNTYMAQQKWEDAVNAYKQTLRNNPQDVDAKYNLSYAEEMMKQQQNQKNKDQKNKDKQNKDQKNKDKQNKDKDKKDDKNKDKQDKNQDNKDNKDDKNKDQQPQSQPSKLSQQEADRMLNALQQEEKKLQDKMKKEKGTPVKQDKDW